MIWWLIHKLHNFHLQTVSSSWLHFPGSAQTCVELTGLPEAKVLGVFSSGWKWLVKMCLNLARITVLHCLLTQLLNLRSFKATSGARVDVEFVAGARKESDKTPIELANFSYFPFFYQIIHFNRGFHYKPSIFGYHYFWKVSNMFPMVISGLGPLPSRARARSPRFQGRWSNTWGRWFSFLESCDVD